MVELSVIDQVADVLSDTWPATCLIRGLEL